MKKLQQKKHYEKIRNQITFFLLTEGSKTTIQIHNKIGRDKLSRKVLLNILNEIAIRGDDYGYEGNFGNMDNLKSIKIRQPTGIRVVSGTTFFAESGKWSNDIGPVRLTLDDYGYKSTATDTRNGYFRGFHTIVAAKAFAKRRKHGRTIMEHLRAERLKAMQERLALSLAGLAKKICVSPRTLEAYYSGCRRVPESIDSVIK